MESDIKKEIFKRIAKSAFQAGVEASPYVIVEVIYSKIFGHRTVSDPIKRFEIEDFPNLQREKAVFKSGDNLLTGYFYNYKKFSDKKIIIFAHGFGNGHARYLEIIDYFASKGFYVFSYDATSVDESEGNGINGFPQGVIDLSNAIKFVMNKGYKQKDIILVGHSWGAYSASAVINEYPHISKVVAFAGFNNPVELIKEHGMQWTGQDISDQLPYMEQHEKRCFGKYADYKVVRAIKKSTTQFYFIHSEDDDVVPFAIGLKLYRKECKGIDRVKYKVFKDRTHICYNTVAGNKYFNELKGEYNKYLKEKEYTDEDKKHLLTLLIDKDKYFHMLDYKLMEDVVKFITN